jgi:hypothetical protein
MIFCTLADGRWSPGVKCVKGSSCADRTVAERSSIGPHLQRMAARLKAKGKRV